MITIQHEKYGDIPFKSGTTRQEIVNYLVELEAAGGEQYGVGKSFIKNMERSASSSLRQIGDWTGYRDEVDQYKDQQEEFKTRVMFEQNPVSSIAGMFGGAIFDPVTLPAAFLKPLTFASKVGTYAARGMAQGGLGGALEPVYDQYGDSTVLNIMAGMGLGAGLGAGVGKLVSKYGFKPKSEVEVEIQKAALQESSEEVLQDLYGTTLEPEVRTRQQAVDKLTEELELEAAGAPSSADLRGLKVSVDSTKARITAMNNVINRMKGDKPLGSKVSSRNAVSKAEAQKVEAEKQLQGLELKYEEGKVLRKAAKTLKLVKNGQWSKLDTGITERLNKRQAPMQRTPIAEAVKQSQPQRANINPFNSSTSRILGTVDRADAQYNKDTGLFEPDAPVNVKRGQMKPLVEKYVDAQGRKIDENGNLLPIPNNQSGTKAPVAGSGAPLRTPDTVGASRVQGVINRKVGEEILPRTVNRPEVTQKLVDGKFKGDNPETSMPMKESRGNAEIRENINRKQARGEELSQQDIKDRETINKDLEELSLFKKFVQKIAGSRALDTAAIRGLSKGRYTFENIGERAELLLKKNGIEDMEDMANYIISADKDKIFSSEEMDMLTPLLAEAEKRLVKVQRMTRFSDVLDDNEIAALHSEINLYYGISAFNKGQGTKVSATLNHRRKMLKDIADGREISSLWAGRSCK